MQGMHGMWELAVNRAYHDDILDMCLLGMVQHLSSPDLQVSPQTRPAAPLSPLHAYQCPGVWMNDCKLRWHVQGSSRSQHTQDSGLQESASISGLT